MAVKDCRETRPDIELGICGEHGGDPDSIHFPQGGAGVRELLALRVPVAWLAAAQAAIEEKQGATFRDK